VDDVIGDEPLADEGELIEDVADDGAAEHDTSATATTTTAAPVAETDAPAAAAGGATSEGTVLKIKETPSECVPLPCL
jgi:hypothetical protein